ncbi:hypothetical protein NQZ79_g5529 [Umbelopsis isabellina]|nr:hypothetical protein NQZ79_g5529 [Umbelopsis isabellina]
MGRDEVWVAAVFYGQVNALYAKPTQEDGEKLSQILNVPQAHINEDMGPDFYPDRGGLMSIPPTDPTLYRFYEILQVYGYPMKAVIHEKENRLAVSNQVPYLRTGRGSERRQGEDHHERQVLAIQKVLGILVASEGL